MKKLISLLLACALAFACLTALGGCGKEIDSKRAFIDSESYYAALADNLAAPVADIDSEAIADAQAAGGYTGKVNFSAEGFEALQSIFAQFYPEGAPALTDLAFVLDFATDGLDSVGSLDVTMLGETLRMIFSSDGDGATALRLPDLLSRALLIDDEMMSAFSSSFISQHELPDADAAEGEIEDAEEAAGSSFLPADDGAGYFDESLIENSVALRLVAEYSDRFFENLPEECYSSGKEYFTTADGEEELDCVCLSADGKALLGALVKTLRELAQDDGLSELFGDEAAQVRDELVKAADTLEKDETALVQAAKSALSWTRFMKNEKIIGDKIYAALPEAEYTVTAGIDEGDGEDYAFLTVVDEKGGFTLFSAESRISGKKGELDIAFDVDGTTYSFSISGKTKDRDGVKTTEANIKIGYGEFSFNVFKIETAVRAFDENRIDFDFEISSDIISMFMKGSALKLKLSVDAERVDSILIDTIDVSDAYTAEEIESGAYVDELKSNMRQKLPHIYAMMFPDEEAQ